jgi:hypothetical protein
MLRVTILVGCLLSTAGCAELPTAARSAPPVSAVRIASVPASALFIVDGEIVTHDVALRAASQALAEVEVLKGTCCVPACRQSGGNVVLVTTRPAPAPAR